MSNTFKDIKLTEDFKVRIFPKFITLGYEIERMNTPPIFGMVPIKDKEIRELHSCLTEYLESIDG